MYANCGSWNTRYFVYKVEIFSLALKWFIETQIGYKTCDQTHGVLKLCLPHFEKMHVYTSRAQAGHCSILINSRFETLNFRRIVVV